MNTQISILQAGDAVVPAYLALLQRGFRVQRHPPYGALHVEAWTAESDTLRATAADPVALLGLVALAESRGEDWKASEEQTERFRKQFDYDPAA